MAIRPARLTPPAPHGGDKKKRAFIFGRDRRYLDDLPEDDWLRNAVAPILASVDATEYRRFVTRTLNEELGGAIGPWDWDDWPLEFVETIIAHAQKDVQDEV